MSEGTAYRAIKDAETLGIVSTIERVGTIRIEKKSKFLPEMLRFNEMVSIIEGTVLGGEEGLDRHLNKFIIGAMRSEEHTSELQSRFDLVCRLLLEKKKAINLHL